MTRLLQLQLVYLVLALGYNIVSYVLLRSNGLGLAATSPVLGFLMVAVIVGPCTWLGWSGRMRPHAFYALFVSLAFCLLGGVLPHVRDYLTGDLGNYLSVTSLVAAAAINFSGAIIFLLSARVAWRRSLDTNPQPN